MKLLQYVSDRSFYRLLDEKKNRISLPFDKNGTILEQSNQQETWVDALSVDMAKWETKNAYTQAVKKDR
ncbi:hypothetical protein [Domibacillus indicus]|uniref:hypothetical protein n=1 Tax=Domibacillus indicus TaxID=1437523 RepID=UPI0006181C95|nr:hypothetical protein [Domibacillus indicus]